MTFEEMHKVVEAFGRVSDHTERADGLVHLIRTFPEFREQILVQADKEESSEDEPRVVPDWTGAPPMTRYRTKPQTVEPREENEGRN